MRRYKLRVIPIFMMILIIALIYCAINFNTLKLNFETLYYFKIKPEYGFQVLEKEYKQNFDIAEKARNDANQTIIQMGLSGLDLNKIQQDFANVEKYQYLREEAFYRMKLIDEQCLKLDLAAEFHQFCKLRQEADQKDFDAFLIYKNGFQENITPTLTFNKYLVKRNQAGELMKILVDNNRPWEERSQYIPELRETASNFALFYSLEIEPTYDRFSFPQDLQDSIDQDVQLVQLGIDSYLALVDGDDEKGTELGNQMADLAKKDAKSPYEVYMQWASGNTQRMIQQQEEGHNAAFYMLQQTYSYGNKQTFAPTLTQVWGDKNPETTNSESSLIDLIISDPETPESMRKQLRDYAAGYSNEYMQFIRSSINDFLNEGQNLTIMENAIDGLGKIDKNVLKSPIIVWTANNDESNNQVIHKIDIIFIDYPDIKHEAVVQEENQNYSLVSFNEKPFTAEEFKFLESVKWLFFEDEKYRL